MCMCVGPSDVDNWPTDEVVSPQALVGTCGSPWLTEPALPVGEPLRHWRYELPEPVQGPRVYC